MDNAKTYEPEQIVFREGEKGDQMYILVSGAVELRKKVGTGEQLLKVVSTPNDFFGEMALVDQGIRSATAVAQKESRLIVVDQPTFERLILTNGQFALKIIKVLSARIRASNAQISELIELMPRERFIRGMVDFALHHGEPMYNHSVKVNVEQMKEWVNSHLGMPLKEIEGHVYRLIKTNETPFASTASQTKDHIVLTPDFIARHDRRSSSDAAELPQ